MATPTAPTPAERAYFGRQTGWYDATTGYYRMTGSSGYWGSYQGMLDATKGALGHFNTQHRGSTPPAPRSGPPTGGGATPPTDDITTGTPAQDLPDVPYGSRAIGEHNAEVRRLQLIAAQLQLNSQRDLAAAAAAYSAGPAGNRGGGWTFSDWSIWDRRRVALTAIGEQQRANEAEARRLGGWRGPTHATAPGGRRARRCGRPTRTMQGSCSSSIARGTTGWG